MSSIGVGLGRPAPQPKALTDLNDAFPYGLCRAKQPVSPDAGPLLIVNGDTATLVRGGNRKETPVNAASDHNAKAMAQAPVALFVALTPARGRWTNRAGGPWRSCEA